MIDQKRHNELALQVCTPLELDALALHTAGCSQWQIALALGISRRSVRDRLDNAHRKILNAQETR
jgi:DNA-binding CsgD family transcriptional regulator